MITATVFWFIAGLIGWVWMRLHLKLKDKWDTRMQWISIALIPLGLFFMLTQSGEVQEELNFRKRS